jgi:hypothetical protein
MTMRRSYFWAACIVALLILTPLVCWSAHDVVLGIKAGVNVANFTGSDVFHNSSSEGAVAGVLARYGLGSSWSLQPEALFTMRGAEFSVDDIQTEQQINYIEVPVLVRFGWGYDASFRPSLFAGPSVAFLLKNQIVDGAEINLKGQTGTRDIDAGAIIGAGLDHTLGAGDLMLDARYEFGLISWSEDLDIRNSTLSFMLGYGIPLGGSSSSDMEGLR